MLAIPLGDTASQAKTDVSARFGPAAIRWLDRHDLRGRPLRALRELLGSGIYDDAVLYAPDARADRLRITTLLLALPVARRRWVADTHGRLEPYSLARHIGREGVPLVRHLIACAIALMLTFPLLLLGDRLLRLEHRFRTRRFLPLDHRPQRILYLRSQFWLGLLGGGSVAHTAGVVRALQSSNVEVRVVSSDWLYGVDAPTTVETPLSLFDGSLREAEQLVYNLALGCRVRQVVREWRPDVLYQRYEAFNLVGAALSRLLRIPLVLEFNSSDVWKGVHRGGLHNLRIAEVSERLQLHAADRVVVVSHVLRRDLMRTGIPGNKVLVNPNGVDLDRFHPGAATPGLRAELLGSRSVLAGFASTFGVWHGVPTLAQAIPLVLRARPDVRFLLLGDGPLRHEFDEAVDRAGVGAGVLTPGLVPHERMPALLAACDILLSPHSRELDPQDFWGSPTILFEYMGAGRAIVASRVGQIGDVLVDGETALLVEPDEPGALADAIIRLVDDASLRARLGQAVRCAAELEHSWERNADRLIQSLVSEPTQASWEA